MAAPALKVQLQGVTTVSSDNLNTYEQTCDTIAQLRGFVGADGVQVFVRGLTAPNDGGAGEFYWDDAATGPDNGVNVIVPTGSALGAWIRLVSTFNAVGTYSFITTAALLTAFASTVVLTNGTVAFTTGRTAENDGGAGEFFYEASDTASADNGGTIRVDTAGRRWYYVPTSNSIPAALFGAANTNADNTTVLNSALSGAAALGFPVSLQHSNFKCLGQLTWDTSKTSIQDGTLDMTGLTGTSVAFKQFTTWTDPNTMAGQHNLYPVRNVRIVGPNNGPGKTCFAPSPITLSGLPWITGLTYRDMCVNGFDVMFDISDGCVFPYFSNVQYGSDSLGHGSEWMFRNLGSTNSGENIYLDHCCCVNTYGFYLEQVGNPNLDMFLASCSMDCGVLCGSGTLGAAITAGIIGTLTFLGGHWEPHWISNEYFAWVGNNAEAGGLTAFGITFVIDNTTNLTYSPFRCDLASGGIGIAPGIILRDMQLFFASTWPNEMMCVGIGNFECSLKGSGDSNAFNGALSSNRCPDYTFAANGLTNWSGSPTRETSDVPAGATGAGTLASPGYISKFVTVCLPGQKASISMWLKYTGPGAGDTLALSIYYIDSAGDLLAGTAANFTSAISAWTQELAIPQGLAPPGTVNVQVQLLYTASGGGATTKFALPIIMVQ